MLQIHLFVDIGLVGVFVFQIEAIDKHYRKFIGAGRLININQLLTEPLYCKLERPKCALSISQGRKLSIEVLNKAMAITNKSPRRLHIHFGSINYKIPHEFSKSYKIMYRVRTPILVIAKVLYILNLLFPLHSFLNYTIVC